MLVLATFLAIGVVSIGFLLRFSFALHSEARHEKERDSRTKQIAFSRILIAGDVRSGVPGAPAFGVLGRKPAPGFTTVYSSPQLARQNIEGLTALLARTTSSGVTLALSESARTRENPKAMQRD